MCLIHIFFYHSFTGDSLSYHKNQAFSTRDMDHDSSDGGNNCALNFKGGWWYNSCHLANLNGIYLNGPSATHTEGVKWNTWPGNQYSLKRVEMKTRRLFPKDCQEIRANGNVASGQYMIRPQDTGTSFPVYCDMDTDGGGWLVSMMTTGISNYKNYVMPFCYNIETLSRFHSRRCCRQKQIIIVYFCIDNSLGRGRSI